MRNGGRRAFLRMGGAAVFGAVRSRALAQKAERLPALEIYSEFQRVDPFGAIVAVDRAEHPREILSPAAPRNAHISFHVAVTAPAGENYLLFVVPNPLNACGVELYRERFARSGDLWIPDALTPLRQLPDFGMMPDPEENIAGQTTRVYLLDLWIPQDAAPPGFRLEVQMKIGYWIVAPMEVRVIAARAPDLAGGVGKVGGTPLPAVGASAEASALGPLREYISGGIALGNGGTPLTVRAIVRRNAIQDMALAGTLDPKHAGPEALKKVWDSIPRTAGAEWYLKIRDFIYGQAAHRQASGAGSSIRPTPQSGEEPRL